MGRLKLIIADKDAEYVASLEKFLIINYPQRFDIITFLSIDKLYKYLYTTDMNDILLVNSTMWKEEIRLKNISCVIMLAEDDHELQACGKDTIKKYQSAEGIVSDIMRIYVSGHAKASPAKEGGRTRIVSVYSPSGGSGKSSIAAGLSILSAGRGLKAFYLNMEDIPCTDSFFSSDSEQCFSNVIYYLKSKETNLGIVLEGMKCRDAKTGVYFYRPADSALEMEELNEKDVMRLLETFRLNAFYNVIYADMPCGLSSRSIALLSGSDIILSIISPGENSYQKNIKFLECISILKRKYGIDLSDKIITVGNRCGNGDFASDTGGLAFDISYYSTAAANRNDRELIRDTGFLSGLNRVLDAVLGCACAGDPLIGGESYACGSRAF